MNKIKLFLPSFFLSYSHKDNEFFIDFCKKLFIITENKWSFWLDNDIKIGENWNNAIYEAIENTQFAIFALSNNFLDSLYIQKNELPKLLFR